MHKRFHNRNLGDFEGTFIKAGDRETWEGSAEKKQQESLGWAVQRKGGFGDRFKGLAWLPMALEFRRRVPVKKEVGGEEGKGNGTG